MFSSPCCLPLRLSLCIWGGGRKEVLLKIFPPPRAECVCDCLAFLFIFFCRWRFIFFFFRFSIFCESPVSWSSLSEGLGGRRRPAERRLKVVPELRASLPGSPSPSLHPSLPPPLLPSSVKNTATSPTRSCAGGCTSPPVCCIFYFFPPLCSRDAANSQGRKTFVKREHLCVYLHLRACVCVFAVTLLSLSLSVSLFFLTICFPANHQE